MRKKSGSSKKKKSFEVQYNAHTGDLPANQGMLQLVRTELKAEMKAGFSQVDARFNQVDAKFGQVQSQLDKVLSDVARVGVLVEEQNSRNRVVMEGLTGLWQRQNRVEVRVDDVEKFIRWVASSRS